MSYLTYSLTEIEKQAYFDKGYTGPFEIPCPEGFHTIKEQILAALETKGLATEGLVTSKEGRAASLLSKNAVDLVPYIECRHLDVLSVFKLCTHPAILDRVEDLIGPDIMIWRSNFIWKKPGFGNFSWHQDFGGVYHEGTEYGLEPPFHISVYIAITDCTEENGGLNFYPGVKAVLPKDSSKNDARYGTTLVNDDFLDKDRVEGLPLKAGQFILFSDRALHSSAINNSTDDRIGFPVRFSLPMVRVRPHFQGHKSLLVRGKDSTGVNKFGQPPKHA